MKLIAMMSVIGVLLPSAVTGVEVNETDYCQVTCPIFTKAYDTKVSALVSTRSNTKPGSHVLCKSFKHDETCEPKRVMSLSRDEQIIVLEEHNRARNTVASGLETRGGPGPQPRASNMMELQWDNELEMVAEKAITECSEFLCMILSRFRVNVNFFTLEPAPGRSANHTVFTEAIRSWYNEVVFLSGEDGETRRKQIRYGAPSVGTRNISRYAHMLAGATEVIGCVKAGDLDGRSKSEYLACVYGPKGFKKAQPLYAVGPPCSKCPGDSKCTKQWPALCHRNYARFKNAQDAIYVPKNLTSTVARNEAKTSICVLLTLLSSIVSI